MQQKQTYVVFDGENPSIRIGTVKSTSANQAVQDAKRLHPCPVVQDEKEFKSPTKFDHNRAW